jgi:predicted ABC-type transport system involved in lysophospholipase L1 biosynthesis ATPase subunit
VVVTHDEEIARRANRIVHLSGGRIARVEARG